MAKKTIADTPAVPAAYTKADVAAIQALLVGTATADQQRRALDWIIKQAACTYEFPYYPSDRDTAFACGKAFVGQQIVKLSKLNLMSITA